MPRERTWITTIFSDRVSKLQGISKIKKLFAYFFFIVAATFFFLYLSFPGQLVHQYLQKLADERYPSLFLNINRVAPCLPSGLRLEQLRVIKKNNPSISLFEADSFVVMPSSKMVVSGRPVLGFDCRAYGGRIRGVVFFEHFGLTHPFQTNIDMSDIQIHEYVFLKERLNREVSGVMSGTVTYKCLGSDPLQDIGQADITIQNGSFGFIKPFFGLSSLDFEGIDAQLELKSETLIVKKASFKGAQITGECTGTIGLNRNLNESSLDLTAAVQPVSSFLKKNKSLADAASVFLKNLEGGQITVKIKGTFAQPRTSFM